MNRRALLTLAAAAPVLAIPAATQAEPERPDLSWKGVIEWSTEARNHEMAEVAYRDLAYMLDHGYAVCSGEATGFGWLVDLKNPRVLVYLKPVWNTWTGYDASYLAPAALIIESGQEIGEYRSFKRFEPQKPIEGLRDSGLRICHLDDYRQRQLDKKLPGQVRLDLRWLEAAKPKLVEA